MANLSAIASLLTIAPVTVAVETGQPELEETTTVDTRSIIDMLISIDTASPAKDWLQLVSAEFADVSSVSTNAADLLESTNRTDRTVSGQPGVQFQSYLEETNTDRNLSSQNIFTYLSEEQFSASSINISSSFRFFIFCPGFNRQYQPTQNPALSKESWQQTCQQTKLNLNSVTAGNNKAEDEENGWRFEFQPYLFVPFSVDGKVVVGDEAKINSDRPSDRPSEEILSGERRERLPVDIDIDLDLGDFFDFNFNQLLWLAGSFEAWRGDVGFILDGAYTKIGIEESGQRIDIESDTEIITADLALGWHLGTVPLGTVDKQSSSKEYFPSLSFEIFGGVSYGSITETVDFNPGPKFEFGPDWFEPLLGGRVKLNLAQNLALAVRAETSIPTDSDIKENWDVLLGLDWQLSRSFFLRPAYRFYKLSVEQDGRLGEREVTLRAEGLWLGLGWKF